MALQIYKNLIRFTRSDLPAACQSLICVIIIPEIAEVTNLTKYQPWSISRICYGAFGDNGFHSTGLAYNWTWPRITLVSHLSHLRQIKKKAFLLKLCKIYFSNFQESCFDDWIDSVPMPFIISAIHWMQCQSGPIFGTCCCSRKFQGIDL